MQHISTCPIKFKNSLSTNDVVLYLGHARSGGGPDFTLPVLNKNNHVDYGYYKVHKPGLTSLISGLSSTNPKVLGILACKSTGLFSGTLKKYLPHSTLITADELFDYNDILPTGLNIIEAVAQQSCNMNFEKIIMNSLNSDTLTVF